MRNRLTAIIASLAIAACDVRVTYGDTVALVYQRSH